METNEIIITDVKMPFLSMVFFMIKWGIATIPALLILCILWGITAGLLTLIAKTLS